MAYRFKSAEGEARRAAGLKKGLESIRAKLDGMTPEQRNEYYKKIQDKKYVTDKAKFLKKMNTATASRPPEPPTNIVRLGEAMPGGDRVRIHWTPTEHKTVAAATAKKMMSLNIGIVPEEKDRTGNSMMLDCFRDVQYNCLPKDRRRIDVNSRHAVSPLFYEFLRAELRELVEAKSRAAQVASAGLPQTPAPVPAFGGPAPGWAPPTPAPQVSAFDAMIDARIRSIVGPLEDFFTDELDKAQKEIEILKNKVGSLSSSSGYRGPEKEKAPVVAVISVRKDVFEHIKEASKKSGMDLEFRLYEQASKPSKIDADWAVIMRFGAHAWMDQVESSGIPAERRAFIGGGVTSVVRQLEAWFKND